MLKRTLATRDGTTTAAAAGLLAASAAAWAGLIGFEPQVGPLGFLAGWTLMMAAMMLPSITPLALLYHGSRTGLAAGYLAAWAAVGFVPYIAMAKGVEPAPAIVLALAGLYELSPLKHACLSRCRNAAAFLMEHYRSSSVRLGVEHGLWCIGCCVGLMALLVFAASMSLIWAAVIAAAVFAQEVLPLGEVFARLSGVALVSAAAVVAAT